MRHTLALAAAAVLVVGAPTAASAQTWNHTDPAGDVTHYTYDDNTGNDTEVVDPTITEADAIGTTVKHNPRKVIVQMRFRELTAPTANVEAQYVVLVKTNEKLRRYVGVEVDSGHPRGIHHTQKGNGRPARCSGVRHTIDYTANTVTISVPRSCLSRPRWVSAGAAAVRSQANDDFSFYEAFVDDAQSPKMGDNLVFSPRLRRG